MRSSKKKYIETWAASISSKLYVGGLSRGLIYSSILRKGVRFHDGSELNATVVKANIDRWFDPTVRAPYRSYVETVKEVEVVDKYTIRIYLKDRYALLLKYRLFGPYLLA